MLLSFSLYEKHLVDGQVLFNLFKLVRRLIELSCSFSAGVLLAHALKDVMLTHGSVQRFGGDPTKAEQK